ncbi:hypothetical protein DVH24_036548 [Malus domestica]|uniref:Uncharacterized protein n=1 Tax=Malus domestica TaxID=3750 RepID=A0A498IJE9_MALDO|nr:hypothetical protein DVH24_036548 [Malus domestica]
MPSHSQSLTPVTRDPRATYDFLSPFRVSSLDPQIPSFARSKLDIWSVGRMVEWRPCKQLHWFYAALPSKSNGFIRVDCYEGLNQMRRDMKSSASKASSSSSNSTRSSNLDFVHPTLKSYSGIRGMAEMADSLWLLNKKIERVAWVGGGWLVGEVEKFLGLSLFI